MPTERLIGKDIEPEHLHDDTLGVALESLYEYRVTELFRDVSAHAIDQLGLTSRFSHSGATSFSFHGEYESEEGLEDEEEPEDGVISVRKGYSRDHRPDLNQVVLNLMVEPGGNTHAYGAAFRFIVAINELDKEKLSDRELLEGYKGPNIPSSEAFDL